MTEQTTTTIEEDHDYNKVEVVIPPSSVAEILKDTSEKKATTPRKKADASRPHAKATRAKSTSKRKPTKTAKSAMGDPLPNKKGGKTNSKAKTTKETKAKATKTKAKEEKTEKAKPPTEAVQTLGQLSAQHQVVLYTMQRKKDEMTYDDLSSEIGLSRAVLRKIINSQTDKDSLVSGGLVVVNQYETEVGEYSSPYYFRLTDTGKKLVS